MSELHKINYLFIDGGYLRKVTDSISQKLGFNQTILLRWEDVISGYEKVFYYDSLPPQRRGEDITDYNQRIQEHSEFINHLENLDCCHVELGYLSGEGERARQKGVDVKIAVDMLTHAFNKNANMVTLLSGDLDFRPVIKALVNLGVTTTIWSEKVSSSKKLLSAADIRKPLSAKFLVNVSVSGFRERWRMYGDGYYWSKDEEKYPIIWTSNDSENPDIAIGFDQNKFRVNIWEPLWYSSQPRWSYWIHEDYEYLKKYLKHEEGIELPSSVIG